MKVDFNLNTPKSNIKFEGYKPVKSDYGYREYEFNYPYDSDRFDCYVEFFSVTTDNNGNYILKDILKPEDPPENGELGVKLNPGSATRIDLAGEYNIAPDQPFAYHYKLYPKNQLHSPLYKTDAGNTLKTSNKAEDIFNIVTDKLSTSTNGGAMKLIVPDANNVMWVYDDDNKIVKNPNIERARKTTKNLGNKLGGSLAGIEKDLDDGKLDNFKRIITTPMFTDDSLSAHSYWNKNNFQMSHSLGNINNYASLQRKLFAKGKNLVADGALVNEGLEGVHFRHVLQYGKKSPYYYWFNISGLENSPLKMGVFGKNSEHVTHRLVNSKYNYVQKNDGQIEIRTNRNYDSDKPTYIQIYDNRLVDAENLSDKELLKSYDKLPESPLDINTHNDTVVPYSFRIDSEEYKKNVKNLNEYNKTVDKKVSMLSGEGTKALSTFRYFGLDGKYEGGFETWDDNSDIAKLNYLSTHAETQNLKNILDPVERKKLAKFIQSKHFETQDYAVQTAAFWSGKTNRILRLYTAQNLKDIDGQNASEILSKISQLSEDKILPPDLDISESIVKNVLNNRYHLTEISNKQISYNDSILKGLMNVPLDSIEVGDDIVSVLASPYMTKRANDESQIGVSRFDTYKAGNKFLSEAYAKPYLETDKMYTKEMADFAKSVLKEINDSLPEDSKLSDAEGNTTNYGKYVIPFLTEEIAKFAILKSVSPNLKMFVDENSGEIAYDYKTSKNSSLLSMGIISTDDPRYDALTLVKKLRHNIAGLSHNNSVDKTILVEALVKSIEGTSLESFKLSEMIVNRAQAGLDWRIDATKDVADIESVRRGKLNFETTWDNIIKFWSRFTEKAKEHHPDAYVAAEITDEGDIFGAGHGSTSGTRYKDAKEAVKKLLNETGFTTTANYSYFSTDITKIFGKLFDFDGYSTDKGLEQGKTIDGQLSSFLDSGSLESLMYSYTFPGNHDKCRALDGYATDMAMVYDADLSNKDNKDYDSYRERAYKILHGLAWDNATDPAAVKDYDYRRVSTIAIAKCEAIACGIGKATEKSPNQKAICESMLKALRNLSNNKHLGKVYESQGFGTKDYDTALDIVLDEMDYVNPNNKMSAQNRKELKDKAFEEILKPAMTKLEGHTAFLTALIGSPTLYAGDEYASTGYETTTKNMYLQNRNIIHEEWAQEFLDENEKIENPAYKKFVDEFKKKLNNLYGLRNRKELHPLNDGTPYNIGVQHAKNQYGKDISVSSILRQSTDGAMTISLFNTTGLNHNFYGSYKPEEIKLDKIVLYGCDRGLKSDLEFVNAANSNDKYIVKRNNNEYYLVNKNNNAPIICKDATLILYHDPTTNTDNNGQNPSFTGRRRTMYNPQYNFISSPYVQKSNVSLGSKLSLISKVN